MYGDPAVYLCVCVFGCLFVYLSTRLYVCVFNFVCDLFVFEDLRAVYTSIPHVCDYCVLVLSTCLCCFEHTVSVCVYFVNTCVIRTVLLCVYCVCVCIISYVCFVLF